MNDALLVRRIQRLGDLYCQVQQLVASKRTRFDGMLQRLSVQKLHRDEGSPGLLADVVNRANVAMVQRAGGPSLTLESDNRSYIRGEILRQELQRYQPSEPGIARLIDDAHAPAA